MAGRIPRSFIDGLLTRVDIVDVIDARVKLKKKGKNYSACCPFHNEKTPSFSVSQEKQFYHCFGCGVHGNAISFLMDYERLEFVEAIEELANMVGVEVEKEQGSFQSNYSSAPHANKEQKRSLYDVMGNVAQFYRQQLSFPENRLAIDYLKGRGLSGDIAKKFLLGFIPDKWDTVINRFGQMPESQQQLIEAGMLIEKEDGSRPYDRFRGRVMFPIRDRRGRVIGFGGRVLDDSTPKYLNSPETPIFHKGKELYGLYEVLQSYQTPPQILVVEGYMDVVALAQFGVDYAVASLGTSTTGDHIQLLLRQTDVVVCCYDGDRAGREAAWRALENALPYLKDGKTLKFMFLPDGEDPDTYIRQHGKEAFEAQISSALPLSEYLFNKVLQDVEVGNDEGKAKLISIIGPMINKIPEQTGSGLKDILNEKLTQKTGIYKAPTKAKVAYIPQGQGELKRTPMRIMIALLLQYPNLAQWLPDLSSLRGSQIGGLELFFNLLDKCAESPNITTGVLLESWRGSANENILHRLAMWDIPFENEQGYQEIFFDALEKVNTQRIDKQIEQLLSKDRSVGLSTEEKQILQTLLQSQA